MITNVALIWEDKMCRHHREEVRALEVHATEDKGSAHIPLVPAGKQFTAQALKARRKPALKTTRPL